MECPRISRAESLCCPHLMLSDIDRDDITIFFYLIEEIDDRYLSEAICIIFFERILLCDRIEICSPCLPVSTLCSMSIDILSTLPECLREISWDTERIRDILAEFRRVDIEVDNTFITLKLREFPIDPIIEACPDPDDTIRSMDCMIGCDSAMHTEHPISSRSSLICPTYAHECPYCRDLRLFEEFFECFFCSTQSHPMSIDDDWSFGK